jgi:dipeptidyl aminopeptidase/acylaminoacyl peptidase
MRTLHRCFPLCCRRVNLHREFRHLRVLSNPALMALVMTLFVSLANSAVRNERPFAVDDLLKLSDVGSATVRPGTDTFVWEQSPPYDTLRDYGSGDTGTWQGSDYEIFTVGPNSATPEKLFQPHERTTYQLGEFSPDGRFLSLLAVRDGQVRMAIFDFQLHRLREFALAPRFPPVQPGPDWAWLDNRRVIVAAYSVADGPWQLTFRRALGNRLANSWAKSWEGKEASVDRYDSSSSDTGRPLPGRLLIVDALSGRIQQLASGQFSGLRPSPDGRWLAAVRQKMLPQSTLAHPHIDWTFARSTLILFSLAGKSNPHEVASDLDLLPGSIEWNASSRELAFFAWRNESGLSSGHFWILDPSTSVVNVVSHDGLSLASQRARIGPQWPEPAVWMGDSLAVFAHSTPGQAGTLAYEDVKRNGVVDPRVEVASIPAHWFLLASNSAPRDLTPDIQNVSPVPVIADGSKFVVVGDGQIWSLDATAPPVRPFSRSPRLVDGLTNQDFFRQVRSNGGGGFFSVAGAPGTLAQVDLKDDSPSLRLLTVPPESSVLALSNSGSLLLQTGAGKGARLTLIHPGNAPTYLGTLNPILDHVAETRWTNFEYQNISGSKRDQLSGCLLLPSDYHSGYKYPMIVEVYPDRTGNCAAPEVRHRFAMGAHPGAYSEHLLAARGFVVFRPDTAGGIARTADGPQADLPAVVDRGVDAVLAAGYGDPGRVGLMGYSQGGFASLWIATRSQRYAAVVSLNGWSDLVSSFFGMNWEQELVPTELPTQGHIDRYLASVGSSFSMGGTPWQLPQRYVQNSPLWQSNAVSAPVLLIHSDMDEFDDESYKEFFSSLYIQKKDARLLIYRGEGHSPSSPANIRDMWRNIFYWFDHYLKVKRDSDGKMILSN